jgi:hypothetical protein
MGFACQSDRQFFRAWIAGVLMQVEIRTVAVQAEFNCSTIDNSHQGLYTYTCEGRGAASPARVDSSFGHSQELHDHSFGAAVSSARQTTPAVLSILNVCLPMEVRRSINPRSHAIRVSQYFRCCHHRAFALPQTACDQCSAFVFVSAMLEGGLF